MADQNCFYMTVCDDFICIGQWLLTNEKIIESATVTSKDLSKFNINISGKTFQIVFYLLQSSPTFRNSLKEIVTNNSNDVLQVNIQLTSPCIYFIDSSWSSRLLPLVRERMENDTAMSYLSTLGGAFSALGDDFSKCARIAGLISVQQFRIALRAGEDHLAIRCRLYLALSFIQQKRLKNAKQILLQQYDESKQLNDFRLLNMCKGIWAKLQYTKKLVSQYS